MKTGPECKGIKVFPITETRYTCDMNGNKGPVTCWVCKGKGTVAASWEYRQYPKGSAIRLQFQVRGETREAAFEHILRIFNYEEDNGNMQSYMLIYSRKALDPSFLTQVVEVRRGEKE